MLWFLIFLTIILSHVIITTSGEEMMEEKSERKKTDNWTNCKSSFQYRIYINSAKLSWKRCEPNLGGSQESFTSDITGCCAYCRNNFLHIFFCLFPWEISSHKKSFISAHNKIYIHFTLSSSHRYYVWPLTCKSVYEKFKDFNESKVILCLRTNWRLNVTCQT